MAAPPPVASTTATNTAASLPVTIPSAASVGDFAILTASLNTNTISTPTGWTLLRDTTATPTTSGGRAYLWTKTIATGEPGSTVTLTLSASSRVSAICAVYGPASVEDHQADVTNTAGTAVASPSVTAIGTADRLVTIHGVLSNTSADQPSFTPAGTMTERADVTSINASARNAVLMLADEVLSAAGATGTRTATASLSVQRQAFALALVSTVAPSTVTLTPAAGALTAVPVTATPGPVTVALTPASGALAAVAVATTPGLVTAALTPAGGALTAVPVAAVPGPVTVALTPATGQLAAVPVAAAPSPVTVALIPAGGTLVAVPLVLPRRYVIRPRTGLVVRPSTGTVTRP